MKMTTFRRFLVGAALSFGALQASAAQAQVFTPTFQSPAMTNDLGVYVSDLSDLAVEGIWRGGPLGLRVGIVDADESLLSIGGELRQPIAAAVPLGLAFTAGAQGLFGDTNAFGVQAGLTAGHTFQAPGFTITPYLHPRIGLVDDLGPDDFEVKALADLGADVGIYPNLIARVDVNLGDGANWGIGLAWRY